VKYQHHTPLPFAHARLPLTLPPGTQRKKIEYRVWNPFRSKLAAAVLGGVDAMHIKPGAKASTLERAGDTDGSLMLYKGPKFSYHNATGTIGDERYA